MLAAARPEYVAESEWGSRRYLDVPPLHERPYRTAGRPPVRKPYSVASGLKVDAIG